MIRIIIVVLLREATAAAKAAAATGKPVWVSWALAEAIYVCVYI